MKQRHRYKHQRRLNKLDLHQFLEQFIAGDLTQVAIVAAIVGAAVFGIIKAIDGLLTSGGGPGLSPNLKFWGAVVLSFVLPLGAYLIVTIQDALKPTLNGVFLAAAVGFTAATALHWVTSGSTKANAIHEAELHPGKAQTIVDPKGAVVVTKTP
jgi:hypothetical protein